MMSVLFKQLVNLIDLLSFVCESPLSGMLDSFIAILSSSDSLHLQGFLEDGSFITYFIWSKQHRGKFLFLSFESSPFF